VQKPGKLFATDKLDYRLDVALSSGASWIGNPDKTDIISTIKNIEPGMLDIVFECCGQQEAIDQAVTLLKPGGKLMIIGIPDVDHYHFSINELRRKEICIQNVRRQNESLQDCLNLLSSKKINASHWITHRFKLSETKKAFDLVAGYKDGVIKAMIEM
jgi:L-iditol 2-dehydrogenase